MDKYSDAMSLCRGVTIIWCGLLWGCLLSGMTAQANELDNQAGIALQSTRVIYTGNAKKGISFTVTNNTSNVYLLQSRVLPWSNGGDGSLDKAHQMTEKSAVSSPFIVLPPLVRVNPKEQMTLRIRLIDSHLSSDKESVFMLALKAIPSQSPSRAGKMDSGSAQVILALQNNLKLFYRPDHLLNMDIDAQAKGLQFSFEHSVLRIDNPTPYYITVSDVDIDGIPVLLTTANMLAPFSSRDYETSITTGKMGVVTWRMITDEGVKSQEYKQPLSLKAR